MSAFGFEYFCGANMLVKVGDMPLLEASGLSISVQESKRPIYGYSSRHFDSVASGQVLVQGQLAINYVHQDYLYHAIRAGLNIYDAQPVAKSTLSQSQIDDYMSELGKNPEAESKHVESLKETFWGGSTTTNKKLNSALNPFDNFSGINLEVIFGEQQLSSGGVTGFLINQIHFTGRAVSMQISEDVILEVYPFFARDIRSLRVNNSSVTVDPSGTNFGNTVTVGEF